MSNELKELVSKLKYLKNWNIEEVAASIGYSRVHLTKEMAKTVPSRSIIDLLKKTHIELNQKESNEAKTFLVRELEIPQDKLLQRMCEFIAHGAATHQVIKLELISLKEKVTGQSSSSISVELDSLIRKVEDGLWEEFATKWS